MIRRVCALVALALLVCVGRPSADMGVPVDLVTRVRGASRAIVGTVLDLQSTWVTRPSGDRIIVSRTVVRIDEPLKGPGGSLLVEIEGGSVGEISMRVSDMTPLARGDRAVLLVEPNADGTWRPHRRGLGVLRVDRDGRLPELGISLGQLRQAAAAAERAR